MKKTLVYLAAIALVAACRGHGSGDSLQREQQQYDVVQEGQSSSAVTSTINAPGEPGAPRPGMTGTNADTTTAFSLPQVAGGGATPTQPGTIAGTLTIPSNTGPMVGYPSSPPRPRPRATPRPVQPPRTDTATTSLEGPPPTTSTIPPTTDTAPPPPPRDRDDKNARGPETASDGHAAAAEYHDDGLIWSLCTRLRAAPRARLSIYNPPPCRE